MTQINPFNGIINMANAVIIWASSLIVQISKRNVIV